MSVLPWYRRLWRLTTSPGVLWFGLPTAIVSAAWMQFEAEGRAWSSLLSTSFLVRLIVWICLMGYVGGCMFTSLMRTAGLDIEAPRDRKGR
jgi:hypothetical protein